MIKLKTITQKELDIKLKDHKLWLKSGSHIDEGLDLSYYDLRGLNFHKADLYLARLVGANLHSVNLNGINLVWADLTDANLNSAMLRGAILYKTILHNANFKNADLTDTIYEKVKLIDGKYIKIWWDQKQLPKNNLTKD